MTPADVERVFGRSRLQIATGRHVEVFREVARHGEERRYTKRFLETDNVDFRPWTEREYRVLVRLGRLPGAPVAKALDFLPADESGAAAPADPRCRRDARSMGDARAAAPRRDDAAQRLRRLRQLVGAGAPVHGRARRPPCARLRPPRPEARQRLHPVGAGGCGPARARPAAGAAHQGAGPDRRRLLARSRSRPARAVAAAPRARATSTSRRAFSMRSRRAGAATWRRRGRSTGVATSTAWRRCCGATCPSVDDAPGSGWNGERHAEAQEFVQQLLDVHNAPPTIHWPHRHLIRLAALRLRDPDLQAALQAGCTFDPERELPLDAEPTPPTRIADYVPGKPEPERRRDAERRSHRLGADAARRDRREPTAEPMAPTPAGADARRGRRASAPGIAERRECGRRRTGRRRRPACDAGRRGRAGARRPVAAIYSGPATSTRPTGPPPDDTAPGPWAGAAARAGAGGGERRGGERPRAGAESARGACARPRSPAVATGVLRRGGDRGVVAVARQVARTGDDGEHSVAVGQRGRVVAGAAAPPRSGASTPGRRRRRRRRAAASPATPQ